MTITLADVLELQPTQRWRLVAGQWHRDHIATLVNGRRCVVWLPEVAA